MVMNENLFAALPPVPEVLVIGGETIETSPLRVGELPGFARALRPLASRLGPDPDWLLLLSEEGEPVIRALAIACRRPPEWVAGLAIDEAIHLAEALFGVNADFFIRRLGPAIIQVSQRVGTLIPGVMPSSGSSGPGTAIPMS